MLYSSRWQGESLITQTTHSAARGLIEELFIIVPIGERNCTVVTGVKIAHWSLGVKMHGSSQKWVMQDEALRGQFYAIFKGKGDWAAKRREGQICIVLEVGELQLRKGTRGHICVVLEAKGGWVLCAL